LSTDLVIGGETPLLELDQRNLELPMRFMCQSKVAESTLILIGLSDGQRVRYTNSSGWEGAALVGSEATHSREARVRIGERGLDAYGALSGAEEGSARCELDNGIRVRVSFSQLPRKLLGDGPSCFCHIASPSAERSS